LSQKILGVHVHLSKCRRGTSLSLDMLKGYMLICRNAEGVHGKRKVGNPWARLIQQVAKVRYCCEKD